MIFFFGKSAIKMCVDITFLIQKNSAILTLKKIHTPTHTKHYYYRRGRSLIMSLSILFGTGTADPEKESASVFKT